MAYIKRTVCPSSSNKYFGSGNPYTRAGWGMWASRCYPGGNCTAYAWGRFHEVLGTTGDPSGCKLGTGNAYQIYGSTYGYRKGSTPQVGAMACWSGGNYSGLGHVAVVEEISADGKTIWTSESGYHAWKFKYRKRTGASWSAYSGDGYRFQGFIYNPGGGEVLGASMGGYEDPRQTFVKEAAKHIGPDGHKWVMNKIGISAGTPWCAATMSAVAQATGFGGKIMPKYQLVAGDFGQNVVENYGGTYIKGSSSLKKLPSVGDFAFFDFTGDPPGTHSKYFASHIGVVESVSHKGIITTIEGNKGVPGTYARRKSSPGNIAWYARPDWSKVQGVIDEEVYGPLYTTKSSRADASIREVCYISKKGEPSIKSTGIKLSIVNYTGLLADLWEEAGGASSGSYSRTNDNIDKIPSTARSVISYLCEKGFNTAGAIGIAANISQESNFNPAAVGDGGTSFGICQWHEGRGTRMKNYVGSNWKTNLSGQLDFLVHELKSSYKGVYDDVMAVSNTESGARTAADVFVRRFEIPANVNQRSKERQNIASSYWRNVVVGGNDSKTTSTMLTKPGDEISSGKTISIPSDIKQTGIISDYTNYAAFYTEWARGTNQRKVADAWGAAGKPSKNMIATLGGYYLVAVRPKFGKAGDMLKIVLTNGSAINAIIGDIKGADAADWGHKYGSGVSIIEWEALVSSTSTLNKRLEDMNVYGKKVAKIINYGSYFR